jgi:geranylgeranyl transferase type-2 subunit alpha
VTSSSESLSRHLLRYRDMNNLVCLRLNNLSLSRIASVEKLLFVQMLDLSHNELHSTEGKFLDFRCCICVVNVTKWCMLVLQDWRQCNFSLV